MTRRGDSKLAAAFRKDPAEEEFLAHLNDILEPHEEASYLELDETLPTLHVIGVPRAGTTLVTQLVAAHLSVGCINNLIAAFWAAPCFGIRLSKKLLRSPVAPTYESRYGRTSGLHEPHEFGYFWARLLEYEDLSQPDERRLERIDWGRLRRVLTNMCLVHGGPMVFKAPMLGWSIQQAQRSLRRACFVRIRRDPLQNALSLLRMREEFGGSRENWVSLRPREYNWLKDEPVAVQIAGQVLFTDAAISRQIDLVSGRNVLDVHYEDVCASPGAFLERAAYLLNANGGEVEFVSQPPASFPMRKTSSPDSDALQSAFESLADRVSA